jgi:arylsulfatase A-like enzyme
MQSRRTFFSSLAGARLLGQPAPARPNVLFISVDDLNDWIGCLGGHPDAKTPNFDRLAARGVLFTNSHCNAPLCNPSRASLMMGIRPSTSGIYDNNQPMRKSPALANAVSLGQHFIANGYRVMGAGKIYHTAYPDAATWQEYFPSQRKNKPDDARPAKLPANGIPNTGNFDWGEVHAPFEQMGDAQVVDWCAAKLKQTYRNPFFLACGIYRPHLPWYVPAKYYDQFPLDRIKLPRVKEDDLKDIPPAGVKMAKPHGDHATVLRHGKYRQAVQGYLASIAFADDCLGRLLDALDSSPYARNTITMLWSDHGWHLGEKLHWRKFSLWEESTHNVFMVTAPGVTRPGGRCERPVSMIDVYPTLIDLCKLRPRPGLEGTSITPLLRNPRAEWNRPVLTTYGKDNHAIRSHRWRYIRYSDGAEELYDRLADEMEWENLAQRPEYAMVKSELARWLPAVNAPESVRERGLNLEN